MQLAIPFIRKVFEGPFPLDVGERHVIDDARRVFQVVIGLHTVVQVELHAKCVSGGECKRAVLTISATNESRTAWYAAPSSFDHSALARPCQSSSCAESLRDASIAGGRVNRVCRGASRLSRWHKVAVRGCWQREVGTLSERRP